MTRALFKQIWLRIRGKYHRFGYAAVSFGAPLSLRAHPDLIDDPQRLADRLMEDVGAVVPILPVPLVAHLLLAQDQTRTALEAAFETELTELATSHAHLPRGDIPYAVEVGLRGLEERGLIGKHGEIYLVNKESRDLVEFYANSIRHLF